MVTNVSIVKGTLKTARFSIPYRIYENEGPHIVCVNGVQQSMGMWHTFISRFCRDLRIVLFDFPNHGKGRFLHGPERLSLDEQVEILHEVMVKTGVKQDVTICTASWGGVVAVAFASKYPDKVKRLVLASMGTKPNKNMVETIKQGSQLDMNNRQHIAQTLIKSFGKSLPERIKQKIVSQFQRMKEESLRAFYEHGSFIVSSKKLNEVVNLKNIKAKTVLFNGEKDTIIDLEDVKFLATQIPNCELRIIKDVGHFLHLEREEVLDIYAEVLLARDNGSQT